MHLVARRAAEFGVEIQGTVRFHMDRAVARKDAIVDGIRRDIYRALERRREVITFLRGRARFLDEHTVDTGEGRLHFARAVIATGARNARPTIPGLEGLDYWTHRSALDLQRLPERLIVVGGGYVGIEFAQMMARFGVQVILLGRNAQLAPGEDRELADLLANYLREEGIAVYTAAAVTRVARQGSDYVVTTQVNGRPRAFRGDALLVATGRVPNTASLDLAAAGVETDGQGAVVVDDQLRTSQPHIWAIGDVKGGWMFTHVATYDGPIAALNAVKGVGRTVDYRAVPRTIFTSPTLAAVGLTEAQAREQGLEIRVGTVDAVGARSKAIGDTRGRLKAVVRADNGEILGFHILAPHGDDLLHEAVVAMYDHGTVDRIARSIHVHPTLSELVKAAARAAR